MLKKIVILGPESTGKSTLCQQLAAHYNGKWCAEYAREYLIKNGTAYSYDDLLTIAKGQLALEQESVKSLIDSSRSLLVPNEISEGAIPASNNNQLPTTNYLFIDTDQHVMQVWCEFVFNRCHTWILNCLAEQPYDLYLLCNIDLPWVKDELREYPDEAPRRKLYHIYKHLMINQPIPWIDISGNYDERLRKAIAMIDQHFL